MLTFFAVLISLLCLVIGLLTGWMMAQNKIERLSESLKIREKALFNLKNDAEQLRIESQARPAHAEQMLAERETHITNLENNLSVLRSKLKERERDYQLKDKDFQRIAAMTAGQGIGSSRVHERDSIIGKLELDLRELTMTNRENVESLNESSRRISELEARIQELEAEKNDLAVEVEESLSHIENGMDETAENIETTIPSNYIQHYTPKYD